jgi:hydroxymethylbilane synthase
VTAVATLRIGTRGSRLAMAQAHIAAASLAPRFGAAEIVPISTRGDTISTQQPHGGWVETDGQFTRELEQALLDGRVDVVVHSFKDLPTAAVRGLVVAAVLERADARDCVVTADGRSLEDLPFCARVGTSSPRRAAQLARARADLIAMPIRGNVETRLRRLHDGEFDAVILAAAGLDRLGIDVPDHSKQPFDLLLPAPAQGALALQARSEDHDLRAALLAVEHPETRIAVEAERSLLRRIGGGCLAPLGALGEVSAGMLRLRAAFEDATGDYRRAEASGPADAADEVVGAVAARILAA